MHLKRSAAKFFVIKTKPMFKQQLLSLLTFVGSSAALDFQPNLLPGLVPPPGTVWRGATIPFDSEVEDRVLEATWDEGADPQVFEDYYGQPLHIYRSFNNHWNAPLVDDA